MSIEQCGDFGKLTLPFGTHEVEVFLPYTPERVYLNFEDQDFQNCGTAPGPSVGTAVPILKGFLLVAVVGCNETTVRWVAY